MANATRKGITIIITLGSFLWCVTLYLYKDTTIHNPPNMYTSVNRSVSYQHSKPLEKIHSSNLTAEQVKLELNTEPRYDVSAICQHEVFLLVLVTSRPVNTKRRNFIRSSWAISYKNNIRHLKSPKHFKGRIFSHENTFKVVFLIGRSEDNIAMSVILKESKLEKDLVLGDFIDTYDNLTMKTRLGLKWSHYACASNFILKTDDDTFVNPIWLVEWLKGVPAMKFYGGRCDKNAGVIRDKRNKW